MPGGPSEGVRILHLMGGTADNLGVNNVLLLPCGAHMERFGKAVLRGVPADEVRPVLKSIGQDFRLPRIGPVRAWGLRDGPRNRALWSDLQRGDLVIFLSGDTVVASGTVDGIVRSLALQTALFGAGRGPTAWPLVVTLTAVNRRNVPYARIADSVGKLAPPRSATILESDVVERSLFADEHTGIHDEGVDSPPPPAACPEPVADAQDTNHPPRPPAPLEPSQPAPVEPSPPTSSATSTRIESAPAAPSPASLAGPEPGEALVDEMTPWYRQGLAGRMVALRAARFALERDEVGAEDSIRRVVEALGASQIEARFPALAAEAESVLALPKVSIPDVNRLLGSLREVTEEPDAQIVRIMIVEDDLVQAHLTREVLSGPGRQVIQAGSVEEAESLLLDEEVSLIILDLGMPGADGRDLLVRLRQSSRTSGTPIIMLSGKAGPQPKTECLALGADAFYDKPVEPATLASAVAVMLERAAEARYMAHRDPLTGLRNRASFLGEMERLRLSSLRTGAPLSLALVDLDNFQALNDEWGSAVGDEALIAVARVLNRSLRQSDLITRWGGDDFALALAGAGADTLDGILAKVVRGVGEIRISAHPSLRLSCSIGADEVFAADAIEDALGRAARRLHLAKATAGTVVSDDRALAPSMRQVLLVEDDEVTAGLISQRLQRLGFDVEWFADGAQALEATEHILAALVILDTKLPGAGGFEVLRRLRISPTYSHVPVLMLTTGRAREVARALEMGATDALPKPFDLTELMARVSTLARGRARSRSPV